MIKICAGKKIDKTGGDITGRVKLKQDVYMNTGKYIHNLMTTVPDPNVLISKGFADSSYIKQGGNLNRNLSTGQEIQLLIIYVENYMLTIKII